MIFVAPIGRFSQAWAGMMRVSLFQEQHVLGLAMR